MNTTSTITFLGLPQEILDMILAEHFSSIVVTVRDWPKVKYDRGSKSRSKWLGIVLTNKSLYEPSMSSFFQNAGFHHKYPLCTSLDRINARRDAMNKIQYIVGCTRVAKEIFRLESIWPPIYADLKHFVLKQEIKSKLHDNFCNCSRRHLRALTWVRENVLEQEVSFEGFLTVSLLRGLDSPCKLRAKLKLIIKKDGTLRLYEVFNMERTAFQDVKGVIEECFEVDLDEPENHNFRPNETYHAKNLTWER
ncbi:hypothetical protein LTS08_006222 [Lithohypha guttulata]|nr:hypothetical protein LTS08_006222 [Lithohypha guttulata]